jgi:glycosyltransferase involved in cell wall biosynthesis
MKILVMNWQDPRNPLAGGAEVQFREVFSRIAAAGHSVTLVCSGFDGAPREEMLDGIRVVRRGGRMLFNYLVPLIYFRRLRHEGFDVVVDDMNKIPFFTPLYVRERICGLVHHLFGGSIFHELDPLSASYVYAMERAALALYHRRGIPFMAVSPSTRSEMLSRGFPAENLCIVPLAVDHEVFRPAGTARCPVPTLGYVGRIKRYKSIDHLIEAMPEVRAAIPGARLMVVGEGDDRPRLERMASVLGLGGEVEFTGYVAEDEKVRRLQQMWCMVMPSSKEGWGLTVTEANACGTPAIASDVPGLRDAVQEGVTGLLFPYGDRKALARCSISMLGNTGAREEMGERARAYAAHFTWEEAAARTLRILQSVCEGVPPGRHAALGDSPELTPGPRQ